MENMTQHNATILLNKNRYGITISRKNFKNKSVVTVRGLKSNFICNYRFDNLEVDYQTQYMNWRNLDFCGAWHSSREELVDQFMQDRKLFADVSINSYSKEFESVKQKIKECESLEDAVVYYHVKKEDTIEATLVKKGCVLDYIDVHKVLDEYTKFGIYIDVEDLNKIFYLTKHPMSDFVHRGSNTFKFDFANPKSAGEYIFNGMLLGYPIESTLAKGRYSSAR